MGKRKIKWQSGDNFLVPLEDGSFGQGQVLSYEAEAMNSAICAFFSIRYKRMPENLEQISEDNLIAVLFVTRDLLDSGVWHIVDNSPTIPWNKFIDIQSRRNKGFIGTEIHGSGIARTFLDAYHKLVPWNCYLDPEYLDKLLVSPDRKPTDLLMK